MANVTVNKGSFDNSSSAGYKRIGQSERIVSIIAGTTLASSAMRSRSLLSAMLLLGASAGLIHRGATGKCGFSKGMNQINGMLNDGLDKVSHLAEERLSSSQGSSSASGANQGGSKKRDKVSEASDDSFPASDSPSFTPVTGESEGNRSHMNR